MQRTTVRIISTVVAVVLLGAAAVVAFYPLPAPAAGGTCGPGASSEAAAAAFFNPGSIGAGAEPTQASGNRGQWQAFVDQCQTAADTRMVVTLALVLGAFAVGFGLPLVTRRFETSERPTSTHWAAPPGWYPDPVDPRQARWWDGTAWAAVPAGPAMAPAMAPGAAPAAG
ncbi:MAG TPA: DUF2510 domain-containing protein [Acidimicrobiales bacterium]|nr:DUF2510 domain-containing protein [Acidimicrobiales bacterium]